jgi:hypothetical protein
MFVKKAFLSFVFLSGVSTAFSQVNMQIFGSLVLNLNKEFKGTAPGAGIRVEFNEEKFSMYGGLGYAAAITTKKQLEATSYYSGYPSPINVTATYKLPMYRLESGGRFYFIGQADKYDGINAFVGLGSEVIVVTNRPNYKDFDEEHYAFGDDYDGFGGNPDGTAKFTLHWLLTGGAGVEKALGKGNLFFNGGIAYPILSTEDPELAYPLKTLKPIPLTFSIGYKFSIGY